MALTGRAALAALAGALVALAFRTVTTVLIVNGLILAAIVADVILAGRVARLHLSRSGDVRLLLGQSGSVHLTVQNSDSRRVRASVRDAWPPSAAAAPSRAKVDIHPGGRVKITTTITPSRRGDVTPAAVTVRSLGPLGLAGRQGSMQAPWAVRVLPPFLSRKHLPQKLDMLRQLDGQHRSLRRGEGSEFDSLRQYVVGDDVRSIDWRSSARRTEVLVRTWRPERDRRLVLVIDAGRTAAGRVGGIPRLDTFMDAALLLAAVAVKAGDRVDWLAIDRRVRARVVGANRSSVLAAMTDAMAGLEAELVESDTAVMASAVLSMARQRCLVVLLTDLNLSALEQGMPAFQHLASRHRLLVAAVADPRVTEMAGARGDATSVYSAAAAEHARAQRSRVSALLRSRGIGVVDAPPESLPPALTDTYLSLKGTGKL